jgi:quinol monooxygenase YgiN
MIIETISFKIPEEKRERFLNLMNQMRENFIQNGGLSYSLFEEIDEEGHFLEVCTFENQEKAEEYFEKPKNDQTRELYNESCDLVEARKQKSNV